MNRAQRRREEREKIKARTKTYSFTEEQLKQVIQDSVNKEAAKIKREAAEEAVNTAMILFLTLPLEVLMDYYWQKSYAKRIPEFTERVLEYYERWQNGELDMEKLKQDLWEYGGVRLEENK